MRLTRLLLLFVLAAAIAGVLVPSASALAFDDAVCPVGAGTQVKVCPGGSTGTSYSVQIKGRVGTGCVPYVSFTTGDALPPGLTMPSSGLISGTPTQGGSWTFWISMQDIPASSGGVSWCGDSASTERQFSITIVQGLNIQQNALNPKLATTNAPYSSQLTAEGGGTQTWSVVSGALPAGLALNGSNGAISGTPTATGDYTFKIQVTNGSQTDSETFTLSVVDPLKISKAPSDAEVGVPFEFTPSGTGGRPGYTWSMEGTLPAGLAFDVASGAISGKPTVAGSYVLKLVIADTLGLTATVDVPLKVAAKLAVVKRPLPAAKVGSLYRARLGATGGVGPLKWNILGGKPGFLPTGIKFNAKTGAFSGTPKKAGIYRLRMQVVDKLGIKSALGIVLKVKA
jgi:large repetitive protein